MNIHMNTLLPIPDFAKARGVTERTVSNWLAAARLPGAQKHGGRWMIPADVQLQPAAGSAQLVEYRSESAITPVFTWNDDDTPEAPVESIADRIARLPAFVPLDVVAELYGLTEYAIRRDLVRFGIEKHGRRYVVPVRVIRAEFGL